MISPELFQKLHDNDTELATWIVLWLSISVSENVDINAQLVNLLSAGEISSKWLKWIKKHALDVIEILIK